ncbi:MAG: YbaN family protein [Propioniciclava sp.]
MDRPWRRTGITRWPWFVAGLTMTGVGLVGVALPGIPSLVPLALAAACFTRSSERMEHWVLGLPGVGQQVTDLRSGLGMPRKAKVIANGMMGAAVGISAWVVGAGWLRIVIATSGLVGIACVVWLVPTRERVLERMQRSQARGGADDVP